MLSRSYLSPVLFALVGAAAVSVLGCGNNDDAYKATPAYTGRTPNLPAVPALPTTPIKVGDAYTVYGASHQLRSEIHSSEVNGKELSIVGYIVKTNIPDAPACAVHKTGVADPANCTNVPIPTFWIADNKGDTKNGMIQVLGWSKNFATVYDAMQKYKNLKVAPAELVQDEVWSVPVPFPLPAEGAKVKVTGKFGYTFTRASTGMVSDPMNGVLTYEHMETTEQPTAPAAFASSK